MLSFTGGLKVFVALEPCDLRKSFNGLEGLVREQLGEDPRAGALFVFTNRHRNRLKILVRADDRHCIIGNQSPNCAEEWKNAKDFKYGRQPQFQNIS